MSRPLGKAEGKQEIASTVKVTRTGDGLSNALEADPRGWDVGDLVPVLMWTEVEDVNHKRAKEGKGVVRKHNFVCTEMVVLDFLPAEQIDGMFQAQRDAVKSYEAEQARLVEEAAGVQRVPFPDADATGGATGGVEGVLVRPEGMSDEDWEGSLPRGDWQGEAAVTPPTPISGRKRRGAEG